METARIDLPDPQWHPPCGTIVGGMKRIIPVVVAFAIVAVLVSIKVRSRSNSAPPADDGSWELADDAPTA